MERNESSKFYATNEDDLPPLITEQQSTISYTVLEESFVPQTAINATPVSYYLPSLLTKHKFQFSNSPKPNEDVTEKNVEQPHTEAVGEEEDKSQSSEETVKENLLDDSEATMEMADVANSLAIVKVEDDHNKGEELRLLEGQMMDGQVKSGVRRKRRKVLPDWLTENFHVEARPRVNGKTVDKYYYHRITNVKCRSVIEAKDYMVHGINPNSANKRKRMESERVVIKFLREAYGNLRTWYQTRDEIGTAFEEAKKEEELMNELERGAHLQGKGEGILKGDPKDKGKCILMEDKEIALDDPAPSSDDEPDAMEISPGCPVSPEDKNLVDVPISWYWSD